MPDVLHTLQVDLHAETQDRSYPISIGRGFLGDEAFWTPLVVGRGVVLVTDDLVAPLYAAALTASLGAVSQLTEVVLPAGEAHKNLKSIQTILDAALADKHERGSLFIALGGGVVGDMTGFAAASFLRGVDFFQVPTTLLAQVDSSVGGKTGVNHAMGKNLIGAFHQPRHVVIDLETLESLPEREFAAGLAEVIKYGLVRDTVFFDWLVENVQLLKTRDTEALAFAIQRSCHIKAEVVAQDEREGGVRAHLNFGHTFGHAIERLQGYGEWLHGEAVAAGRVIASRLSVAKGSLAPSAVEQLEAFNHALGLPVALPRELPPRSYECDGQRQKVAAGKVRYILLREMGDAMVTEQVTEADITGVINA